MKAVTTSTPTKRWTLDEAAAAFPAISELAESYGFRISLFGSTLIDGSGNDLDLLFTPFGSLYAREVEFMSKFGGVLKTSRFNPAHNVKSFQVERDGKMYDFVFGGFWSPRRKK